MNLIELLPFFYENSEYVTSLMNAESKEIDLLQDSIDDLINNLFVTTATWGLDYFEEELGIISSANKSYEERREVILAKKRGNGTVNKKMIQNTAEAFSGGEVDVIENNNDYSFTIKFSGTKGIPRNIEDFKAMIEEIKPAHLSFALEYAYNVWNFIQNKNMTWDTAKSQTWDSMMVFQ